MCGIAGCIGHEGAPEFAIAAVDQMENRGYDSAGIAIPLDGRLEIVKTVGGVASLPAMLAPDIAGRDTAIGHTRWATHGAKSIANAHPHTNESETIAVVCNGIIENHNELREELLANGYSFSSETDTEVLPHLFDYYMREGMEPDEAFRTALTRLTGSYAVLAISTDAPDRLYAAAASADLILGVSDEEHFAASEISPLSSHAKGIVTLDDHTMAILSKKKPRVSGIRDARRVSYKVEDVPEGEEKADKGEFAHFMLKEIHDSPTTIRSATAGRIRPHESLVRLGGLNEVRGRLRDTDRIIIVGCGTSYYAGLIGEQLLEQISGIPTEVELASEFKYRDQPFNKNTAVIAISQSGTTADTIAAVEKAGEHNLLKLGIVNKPSSTITRITDAGILCHAGQEVSVASTKAFTSQVTVLTELAILLARQGDRLQQALLDELAILPEKVEEILADTSAIQAAAKKYAHYEDFLYIGRGYNQPVALEGALKLKEVSYIHAEGYGAGEMKHGPLALIDEDFPTLAIATDTPQLEKTLSNIEEIRSRGGPILAIASEGNVAIAGQVDDVIYVPKSLEQTQPILNSIVLQLFAYYVAVERGVNVDKPRNLAKSVTVE